MSDKIRYIVIDDERLARAEMKLMMQKFTDFVFVGEASNASEAEKLVIQLRPGLIFLDIQMPEKSGFDLLSTLDQIPAVIFTTAFEQYAVKAFDLNALDYLLKPIRQERLQKAIEKIKASHDDKKTNSHLLIKEGEKIHFLKTANIYLIESIGNYVRIYFDDEKVFFKRSLKQLEKILDSNLFFRINRSRIINVSFIQKMDQLQKGRLALTLKNGETLIASNRQSAAFKSKTML